MRLVRWVLLTALPFFPIVFAASCDMAVATAPGDEGDAQGASASDGGGRSDGGGCGDCKGECVQGVCKTVTACKFNSDCPRGEICKDKTECVPGCNSDADCPEEKPLCNDKAEPHGACVACLTDADCTGGGKCTGGACKTVTGCKLNSDCPRGEICKDKTECVPGCSSDADCPEDRPRCKDVEPHGACVACLSDGDCTSAGEGYTCDDGTCIPPKPVCDPPCMAWEECWTDLACHAKPGLCGSDADCQSGPARQICDINTHKCVTPECIDDGDCGDAAGPCPTCGGICVSNKCQCILQCGAGFCEACTEDRDCDQSQGLQCGGFFLKKCTKTCASAIDCGGKFCGFITKTCFCGFN